MFLIGAIAVLFFTAGGSVHADYELFPEISPDERCGMIEAGAGAAEDPGGAESLHCQRLFWDLPAATRVGFVAAAAPFEADRIPRFPGGLVDRPPPLYIFDRDGDGVSDDGRGYESPGEDRVRLCTDPDEVPWWKPLLDDEGEPVVGSDPTYGQTGPLHVVACRRGTRARFGPWQPGTSREQPDALVRGIVRFENSARLERDVEVRGLDPKTQGRMEWHTGVEMFTHFGNHHLICWSPENAKCNNPADPWTASDPAACGPGYQEVADPPKKEGDDDAGSCWAGAPSQSCRGPEQTGESVRALAVRPGRTALEIPGGGAIAGLEDQLWSCDHHVVLRLVPGLYGIDRLADFRLQRGGLGPGGVVGEILFQYFTEPKTNPDVRPVDLRPVIRTGGLSDFAERFQLPGREVAPPADPRAGSIQPWPDGIDVFHLPNHGLNLHEGHHE